jgi:UPF0716 family protein affecting phage T7 exclusion
MLRIEDPTDDAFPIEQVFFGMALVRIQCTQELRQIQATLAMGENDDAAEAFRKIAG